MGKMTTAYIGLGSNVGNREESIRAALRILAEAENIEVARISELIETPPLGGANQPKYLNAVAEVKTTLSAEKLHKILFDIESTLGRVREKKWSPRLIDLDLLILGGVIINSPDLTVPHPQMHLRSFVLQSLCELNGELLHPVIKESITELAGRLGGADFVLDSNLPQLISVAGIIGIGKTTLTKKLSNLLRCKLLLEPYDANPFMPDVYAGKKELALDSQLFFLTSRIMQLNHNTLAAGQIAISDYIFDKEPIYAKQTLTPEQLKTYEKIYQPSLSKVAKPVLVIYLQDSAQNCLVRIHKRNRPYEQQIQMQFLEALRCDYEKLLTNWKICPVIRIQISKSDYTNDANVEHLANQIKSYLAV
ncbi:MAG: 2-amino-4-hydroxy-6-hydroxymethyldihydropteridine diphosphokinase [Planctomycetota bacterium]|nr:MAG: 2-amino-4-hydroxy-6-hydroxymethyldihydropteridine diphosphokinase [Planctomycetota bacterium]